MPPPATDPALPPLEQRYLLLTFIPYYVDARGGVWLDRLWHHDFVEHLRYLSDVVLAAPSYPRREGPDDLVRLEAPDGVTLSFVPLPHLETTPQAVRNLPALVTAVWRAAGDSAIVHSGVAGWPIPVGWVGNAVAMLRRRRLVIVVESAPWRPSTGDETARQHVRALIYEALARFFVRRADVSFFTQPDYLESLAGDRRAGCYVTPATWIREEDILDEAAAERGWEAKRARPVRLLFAGRLVAEKGVEVLLAALERLEAQGTPARVDVIGAGPLEARCREASRALSTVALRVQEPVPYGEPFFERLRAHHAVLVPNLGDEQPRIVFDAYAQAVPVIASDTDGLRPHVDDGETGWRVRPGDVIALADAIGRATDEPATLERMGRAARERAPRFTHRGMHESRWRVLVERFGRSATRP